MFLTEVAGLFPSRSIHLGGDEAVIEKEVGKILPLVRVLENWVSEIK